MQGVCSMDVLKPISLNLPVVRCRKDIQGGPSGCWKRDQKLGDARKPLPMRPGDNQKTDSEYVRNGTCSIFAFVEPLGGTHHVSVRELGLQQLPNRKLL